MPMGLRPVNGCGGVTEECVGLGKLHHLIYMVV